MKRFNAESIIKWLEEHQGQHSIRDIAVGLGVPSLKVRVAIKTLESTNHIIRTTLDPIKFKVAGCRNVYKDKAGLNVRCTTQDFHDEHKVNGYKQVRVPVGKAG